MLKVDNIIPLQRIVTPNRLCLHNGMILSTLSISSHGFTFDFPKRPRTSGNVFLTYKSMITPLISQCGCNSPSPPLVDILLFGLFLPSFPSRFKMRLLEKGFHSYKKMFHSFSSPTNVGSHNPPPLGPMSSLAHPPVFGSNTICNGPNPTLAEIVLLFGLSLPGLPLKVLIHVCQGEVSTSLQKMLHSRLQPMWDLTIHPPPPTKPAFSLTFVPLSNQCGILQSTPLQNPAFLLTFVPLSNRCEISQCTPLLPPNNPQHSYAIFCFLVVHDT